MKQLGSTLVRDGFPNMLGSISQAPHLGEAAASEHSATYQFPVPRRAVAVNVLRLTTLHPFPSTDSNWPKQVYERGGVVNLGVTHSHIGPLLYTEASF